MTGLIALPCTGSAQVVDFFNDKLSTLLRWWTEELIGHCNADVHVKLCTVHSIEI